MLSYHRQKSRDVIAAAKAEGEAHGLEGKLLERFVAAAYPFETREAHPFRAWRAEFRIQMYKGRPKRIPAASKDLPGQMYLFDDFVPDEKRKARKNAKDRRAM